MLFGLKPQGWEKGNKLVKGLSRYTKYWLGFEAVKSIAHFVESITETATHLISLSTAMGMTVEQTQEWGYVAQQSGSNLKELSMGTNMLLRNLDKFSRGKGGKELAYQFTRLGLTAEDAKKAMSGPNGFQDVLFKMSDKLKVLGKDSKTAEAVMTQLMGVRAGRAMLADMARGSDGIKQLMQRRRDMGELTTEQATTLRDLGNHVKDLKTSFEAMAQQVFAKMAPELLKMVDAAMKWLTANKDIISGALTKAINGVAAAFRFAGDTISWFFNMFRAAMNGDDGAFAVLTALVAVITGLVVPAVLLWAYATLLAIAPYVAIAAAVALVTYGLIKLGEKWPEIKAAAEDALNWIWDRLGDIVDFVTSIPGEIRDAFVAAGHWIVKEFDKAMDAVAQAAENAWHKVRNLPIIKQVIDAGEFVHDKLTDNSMPEGLTKDQQGQYAQAINTLGGNMQASAPNVTVGDTHIEIKVNSTDEARKAKNDALEDRDAQWRSAVRGTGGKVQ